jgi:hypothetical protein
MLPLRWRCAPTVKTLLSCLLISGVGQVQADDYRIMRLEEEWELVVTEPDSETAGPQVTCILAPRGVAAGRYATLELNHSTEYEFTPGGVHLQLWDGDVHQGTRSVQLYTPLSTRNETVRWTQVLDLNDGTLTFEIKNGTSASWGNFTSGGTLKFQTPTTMTSLNNYSPDQSAKLSGIGYGSNRVSSLTLKKVKLWTETGATGEWNVPRVSFAAGQ